MFRIPGVPGKDLCDNHLGSSRRDILRVGGAGIILGAKILSGGSWSRAEGSSWGGG